VPDVVRLGLDDDETAVTAGQLRELVSRLVAAGAWQAGDRNILILADAATT
jgi:hypothetical protein